MVWFKVDDKFHTSGKVLSIPRSHRLAAVGLWTLAGAWSAQNLTDGIVPEYVLREFGATPRLRQALVEARLWLDHGSAGIEFLSWDEYQRSRHRVEAERAQTAERVAKWRNRRRGEVDRNGVTGDAVTRYDSVSNAVGNGAPDPTRPDPIQNSTSSVGPASAGSQPDKGKRATRLPASWAPTDEHRQRARESGVDIEREVLKFRTHAEDKGRTSKSWNAAFTQWLIKAAEYTQQQHRGKQRTAAIDQWMFQ